MPDPAARRAVVGTVAASLAAAVAFRPWSWCCSGGALDTVTRCSGPAWRWSAG
jgi:hypothetical protein